MNATVIQELLPPVLIISSCGLLSVGQFARYTAILGLVRGLHRERLDLLLRLSASPGGGDSQSVEHGLIARRAEHLESQTHRLLGHAKLIRMALLLLVGAVVLLLVCSLLIGLEKALPAFCHGLSVATFVLGLFCMLGGMLFVFAEVRHSLEIVLDEHAGLEGLAADHLPPGPPRDTHDH